VTGPRAPSLSRWTGEFLDPDRERAFRIESWPRLCLQLRAVALIAGVLYAAVFYPAWQAAGGGALWRVPLVLRLCTALGLGAVAWASPPSWPERRAQAAILLVILFLVATRLVEHAMALERPSAGLVFPALPLVAFAMVAIPLRLALLWSGVGAALLLWDQAARYGLGGTMVQLTLVNLLLAIGVGWAFRASLNRFARRDFALRQDLRQEVAERQAAEREARRADAAKSRFLAVMSHEIRTPLNGVLGGVQILEGGPLLPEQVQILELVSRSGEQLARLLGDVLDLSRIEAGRLELAREPFSPAALLQEVRAVLEPQARAKDLALRVELPAGLAPALAGDALRLGQVLLNLAGNAVKFTGRGEVTLSLETTPLEGVPARIRCAFTVRDTGPGVAAEDQERIWAAFEQGSAGRWHGGAGLGLAISRDLVAAMGGALSLESRPGQGCAFRFAVELEPAAPPEAPGPVPARRPLRVLVVDDLEANRIVAEGLLAGLGHRTLAAADGARALELVRTEPVDAVLLDLHMPDLDGLEWLRRLRALPDPRQAGLPVFLASADTESSHVQACLDAGMQGAVPKPLRRARLAELLGTVPGEAGRAVPGALGPCLVDHLRVARLKADLGAETWLLGLGACRASVESCLADTADPALAWSALHRLAGLAGAYAMPRLLLGVRGAEAALARGGPCPGEELAELAKRSLEALGSAP